MREHLNNYSESLDQSAKDFPLGSDEAADQSPHRSGTFNVLSTARMTPSCRLCAAQLARTAPRAPSLARSTLLASSSSPASTASRLARHATPVSPWSPGRSVHSAAVQGSALLPATRSRATPPLSSSRTLTQRRNIACAAEAPENPSEDFESVEEELQEGERLEMHLTDAAIKVSQPGLLFATRDRFKRDLSLRLPDLSG